MPFVIEDLVLIIENPVQTVYSVYK